MNHRLFNISSVIFLSLGMTLQSSNLSAQNGEELFAKNCKVCHSTGSNVQIGPGMEGVTDKRSSDWLMSWIKDSKALVNSGDADAQAIYNEFGEQNMPAFPQLSDGDINDIIEYLGSDIEAGGEDVFVDVEYTEEQIVAGKKYFAGETAFINGGPQCATCHNVNDDDLMGGFLAKDLTDAYPRMGEVGILGMVGNAPFPAMKKAYENNPLTPNEMTNLSAYLKSVSVNKEEGQAGSILTFFFAGVLGVIVFIILIMMIWSNRKRESVKAKIFERQINAIN